MTCAAVIFAFVANLCVLAFGKVTNGSVTAFLLEEYKDNKSLIVFVMIANTAVSLSVLFTYPLQLFPTFELLGPKAAAWWWKFRHGGKRGELGDDEEDENDLTGFDPMPTLPEHDEASIDNEHIYENFESVANGHLPEGDGAEVKDDTRSSMVSDVTDFAPPTILGDTIYLRAGLVFMTYLVAAIVPNVQALISLSGALAGSSTALLIPPILELALIDHLESKPDLTMSPRLRPPSQQQKKTTYWRFCRCDVTGKFWKKRLKCFFLFWMGFVFMLIGAYASVSDIVSIYMDK
jgi:proton-coupled amino acid transporter